MVVSTLFWTMSAGLGLTEPAPPVYSYLLFWLCATFFVVNIVLLVVQVRHSRVSLTSVGVEVRQVRTRLYPYEDITAVRRNPWFGGVISLLTRDGKTHVLPAPVRGRGGAQEPVVAAAFAEIRRRTGEGSGHPPRR